MVKIQLASLALASVLVATSGVANAYLEPDERMLKLLGRDIAAQMTQGELALPSDFKKLDALAPSENAQPKGSAGTAAQDERSDAGQPNAASAADRIATDRSLPADSSVETTSN